MVWFGIFMALAGWSLHIFTLPTYLALHLFTCMNLLVTTASWVGFGLSWFYGWLVSPYFQATCPPLALHLFTCMDLLVTTASWVWFGIFMALL
jgi:hypothetical protein